LSHCGRKEMDADCDGALELLASAEGALGLGGNALWAVFCVCCVRLLCACEVMEEIGLGEF